MSETYTNESGDECFRAEIGGREIEVNTRTGDIRTIFPDEGQDDSGVREPSGPHDPIPVGTIALDTPPPTQTLDLAESTPSGE